MATLDYGLEGLAGAGIAEGIGQVIGAVKEENKLKAIKEETDRIRKIEQDFEMQKLITAKQWEIDKMKLNSELLFKREVKLRERKEDEYQATIDYLENRDDLDDEQKKVYGFKAFMKKQGVPISESMLLPKQRTASPATVSNKIAAVKELQKSQYKEPGRAEKLGATLTGGLIGRKELEPELAQQKAFLQDVVGINDTTQLSEIEQLDRIDDAVNTKPANVQQFEAVFKELYKIDKNKAQAYFNKYDSLFPR